jgi:hypothetical protein
LTMKTLTKRKSSCGFFSRFTKQDYFFVWQLRNLAK